jgi:hypothetical protein
MDVRLLDRSMGGYRWHLMRTIPATANAGAVARWYGTATDINGQKRGGDVPRDLAGPGAALVDYECTLPEPGTSVVPYSGYGSHRRETCL